MVKRNPNYKYDKKILLQTLNSDNINKINKLVKDNKKILIEIPNTRGISSKILKELDSSVDIRIAGAYDKDLVKRRKHIIYNNGETGKYVITSVIYTKNEVLEIIREMEKIEKGFEEENFQDIEKVIYIYSKLKSSIMYDPKKEGKKSKDIRSLRGLISKETVCAGYAVIFKEMLDRQGIESHYVSGKTYSGGGHAWNIVTLNGKNYPIDLTWDNKKFRSGDLSTFDFLGQDIENFKRNHIPNTDDPCKDYELSSIDPKIISKLSQKLNIKKEFNSTSYFFKRKDGSKYMVAQIGNTNISGTKIYRYYYYDIDNNGNYINQSILYSEENITDLINRVKFNKTVSQEYVDSLNNILLSRKNIEDSVKNGTGYIGNVEIIDENGKSRFSRDISEIQKSIKMQNSLNFPTRVYKRKDQTSFIVQKMSNHRSADGIYLNEYDVIENVMGEDGKYLVKQNRIFSERDFLQDLKEDIIANELLSRSRIDSKSLYSGGYIGYLNDIGKIESNYNLERIIRDSSRLKSPNEILKENKEWIINFIEDYKASFLNSELIELEENENIRIVLDCVKNGKINFLSEYLNKCKISNFFNENELIDKFARLLIESDNLTIDSSDDYIEKFISIPQINLILNRLKNSDYIKYIKMKAEENRKSHLYPNDYNMTLAEKDKKIAQSFLATIESQNKDNLLNNKNKYLLKNRVFVPNYELGKDNNLTKQSIISLIRVFARQEGLIPSKVFCDQNTGKWYFDINRVNITPKQIVESTQTIGAKEIKETRTEFFNLVNRNHSINKNIAEK